MTSLDIWLIIALLLTSSAGGLLLWYLRKLLRKYVFVAQNLLDLVVMVDNYQKHLKQVYNMETYHGDETIKYLMQHTNSLLVRLEDYKDVYDISEPLETLEETPVDENSETSPEEEAPEENPFPVSEENVFYAGTRRRDS